MYDPAGHRSPNLAFLWPALLAAATSEIAAAAAKQFTDLAVGLDGEPGREPLWTTPHTIRLELGTVRLRDFSRKRGAGSATLLCAPYALHSAAITDLAPGHSLVAALRQAGLSRLFVTDWRSAVGEMRFLGIDDYLATLNVLVEEIGAPVDLVGLCQGGWMALIFAARFPAKVRKLVLVGAPIDTAATPSALSRLAAGSPLATFQELVRLGDGILPGRKVLKFWGPESVLAEEVRELLQSQEAIDSPAFVRLNALFQNWYAWTVNLPGRFFLQSVERLYKRNELAAGGFVALGHKIDLASVRIPMFLLAARDDELVAPAQLLAMEHLAGTPGRDLRQALASGRHIGLFAGKRTLEDFWPRIVRWLGDESTIASNNEEGRELRHESVKYRMSIVN
jgi:poly(3-hydroxybutyrate) depolymerase